MKKWKYLGGWVYAYLAVAVPCVLVVGPLIFACVILASVIDAASGIDAAWIIIIGLCIYCSTLCGWVLWKNRNLSYAWGNFQQDAVYVKVLFDKVFPIYYDKCKSCGIAYYRYAYMNNPKSIFGSDLYYIFLSVDMLSEESRDQIIKLAASKTHIKVGFNKELYEHLLIWLPKKQADMLQNDYYRFFVKKENKRS